MSEAVPGMCRSLDCNRRADFYLEHQAIRNHGAGRKRRAVQWSGEFCLEHMMRVIEMKIDEMRKTDVLCVEKMRWIVPEVTP